jgi:hypothetical protein
VGQGQELGKAEELVDNYTYRLSLLWEPLLVVTSFHFDPFFVERYVGALDVVRKPSCRTDFDTSMYISQVIL